MSRSRLSDSLKSGLSPYDSSTLAVVLRISFLPLQNKSDLRHYKAETMTPNKLPQLTAIYPHKIRTLQEICQRHPYIRSSRVSR